ncbi:MAG: hypothetical protein AAGE01_12815 [Pseudomonadota bacterium]
MAERFRCYAFDDRRTEPRGVRQHLRCDVDEGRLAAVDPAPLIATGSASLTERHRRFFETRFAADLESPYGEHGLTWDQR